jgi:hypothetical protein
MLLGRTLRKLSKEDNLTEVIYQFELELLRLLGFHAQSGSKIKVDTQSLIESILEKSLKAKQMFHQLS